MLQSFLLKGHVMGRRSSRRRSSSNFSFRPKRVRFDRSKIKKGIFGWLFLVLGAAVLGYAVIAFCFQTVTVFGPSMNDTLEDGQVVIVNKLSYKFGSVKRFDIIAYSRDNGEYYDIKRVIGLPGETIKIDHGYIYIDGLILDEDIYDESILNSGIAAKEIKLGKGEYFVLGDNINNSEDSRFNNVGNVNKTDILGKVVYVYSPKGKRGKVK